VTGRDVSGSDMPRLPWPAGRSALEDTALAGLLDGNELPSGAAAELRHVADMLAALRAGPGSDELAGLAAVRAEFRRRVAGPARPGRSRRRGPARLAFRLGAKAAAAAAIVAIGLGSAGAAAYAGALPGSWQQFAHRTIGAPAPHQTGGSTRARPNPAGHPAQGECTAYLHGTAAKKRAALRDLVKAAGGAGNVAAFCAALARARSEPARPQPTGRVTTRPAKGPADHRSKRPNGAVGRARQQPAIRAPVWHRT
jgi:hypothetical protein